MNLRLDTMVRELLPLRNEQVTNKSLWFPTFHFCHYRISYFLYNMALQVIPAALLDIALRIMGKKPQILKLYRQIESFADVIHIFISSSFTFENKNMKRVCNTYVHRLTGLYVNISHINQFSSFSMTSEDKRIFPCDFDAADWPTYRDIYVRGVLVSLIGDHSDRQTLQKNADKWKRIHYTFVVFCVLCAGVLFYMIVKNILF